MKWVVWYENFILDSFRHTSEKKITRNIRQDLKQSRFTSHREWEIFVLDEYKRMEWLHLPLKSYVVYLRASNAKIAFEILTGGEIASSVECAMGDKPPLFLGEPVRREKGRCGQVNDPLSRGRRGVAAAAAVIAETSCCRLREAKGKGGRERVGARARGPRGGPQPGASCNNEERRCTRARGTFDEAAIERTGQRVCTRRWCRCVDAGRAQMPTR